MIHQHTRTKAYIRNTYKELKQSSIGGKSMETRNIRNTYKELKQCKRIYVPTSFFHIRNTYKELKLELQHNETYRQKEY